MLPFSAPMEGALYLLLYRRRKRKALFSAYFVGLTTEIWRMVRDAVLRVLVSPCYSLISSYLQGIVRPLASKTHEFRGFWAFRDHAITGIVIPHIRTGIGR
jgi:hypothetical protein